MSKTIGELRGDMDQGSMGEAHPSIRYQSLVGVELELEGMSPYDACDLCPRDLGLRWSWTDDGSLRGLSVEAVLSHPLGGADLHSAVAGITDYLKKDWGRVLSTNHRTSMHVHIDVRDITPEQLAKIVMVYAIFEKPLISYSGPGREHSNFCIPLYNAAQLCDSVAALMEGTTRCIHAMIENQSKYSALNLLPIRTFGSIEFRSHRGTYNYDEILSWINILLSIKRWAVHDAPGIEEFPAYFSGVGPTGMCKEVFGRYAARLVCPDFDSMCYSGMRCAQDLLFHREHKGATAGVLRGAGLSLTEEGTPFGKFKSKKILREGF